jgi:hypothetical protein
LVRISPEQESVGSRVGPGFRWIYDPAVAALLLLPTLAALALAQQPLLVALAFVVHSALMGVISTGPGIGRGELGQLPDARQALGEWAGPLLGAALVLAGGPTAVFAAAALVTVALAWSLMRR